METSIYKRLAIAPPVPEAGDEMPMLVSPAVRLRCGCSCGAAYTPLRYLVPGVTRAQHLHAQSGGIYAYLQSPPRGWILAEGRALGDVRRDGPDIGRAEAVRLDRVVGVWCVWCDRPLARGPLSSLSRDGGRLLAPSCDGCAPRAGAPVSAWGFALREGALYWTRPLAGAA